MRPIEQIAVVSQDIERHRDFLTIPHSRNKWTVDTVEALHVAPSHVLGQSFKVRLAFNYHIVKGKEFELIQLLEGWTIQLYVPGTYRYERGLSHLGYHVADQKRSPDALKDEVTSWAQRGFPCHQISETIGHTGKVPGRYRYAFIDTRMVLGTWLKIIQRLKPDAQLPFKWYNDTRVMTDAIKKEFAWLND